MNDIDCFQTSIFCKINDITKSLKIKEWGYNDVCLFLNINDDTEPK